MIEASGIVIALDGDFATVRMEKSGCGRCHEAGGCSGNNVGKMFCSSPRNYHLLNPGKSVIGDRVVVAIDERTLRRSAIAAYVLPLFVLFIGALVGSGLAGEIGAILGASGGLLFSWIMLRYAHLRRECDQRSQPHIKY